ncbi:MAG: sulfatase-like hydrolase/transferase, partial [Lentisphaeraceae bacterium]|nr:sulfatase-like hydrolase/transferase [Lentisphaeraceae bacterium]
VPSRYGLMTSTYPWRNGRKWTKTAVIEKGQTTIASMLKEQGYQTCMIGKWHLGFDTARDFRADTFPGGPVDRGFDEFFGLPHSLDIQPYLYIQNDRAITKPVHGVAAMGPGEDHWNHIQGKFYRRGKMSEGFDHNKVLDILTEKSITRIKNQSADKPLFLYVPLTAPHTPWLPAERFMKKFPNNRYGAFVAQVDDCIARIHQAVSDKKMADNTIFIVTSDNGPVWYEKDFERTGHQAASMFRGMKGDVWEGGHRMPFIISWPGKIKAASTTSALCSFMDIMPTLADLIGDKKRAGTFKDGISFAPALQGLKSKRDTLIMLGIRSALAIRKNEWKLIPFQGSGGFSKPARRRARKGEAAGQLYNLSNDPGEQNNLYEQYPEIAQELSQLLKDTTK